MGDFCTGHCEQPNISGRSIYLSLKLEVRSMNWLGRRAKVDA